MDSLFTGCTNLTSVIFENPKGWTCADDDGVEKITLSEEDLSNPATAATLLTETYAYYIWSVKTN